MTATSRCLGAENLPPSRERLDEQRLGRGRVAPFPQKNPEVVEALGHFRAPGPEDAAPRGQRLVQERPRLVELAEALEGASHHGQHLGFHFRLARELFPDARRPSVEEPADGDLLRVLARGVGIRPGQESRQELAHLGRFLRLETGPIALPGQPYRVEGDQACKQQDRRRRRGHATPVSARELRGAIGECVGPRRDRLMSEVVAQVVCESGDGRIALGRVLLQRLRDDRVEVPLEKAAESVGRRGTHLRVVESPLGRGRPRRGRRVGERAAAPCPRSP